MLTLFLIICYEDAKHRKIYNKRIVGLFFLLALKYSYGLYIGEVTFYPSWYRLSVYIAISLLFFALGAFRLIGMGDVKLIMVLLIFIDFGDYKLFLFHMTVVGGILALIQLKCLNYFFDKYGFSSIGVPYAIPITISYIMHTNTFIL